MPAVPEKHSNFFAKRQDWLLCLQIKRWWQQSPKATGLNGGPCISHISLQRGSAYFKPPLSMAVDAINITQKYYDYSDSSHNR